MVGEDMNDSQWKPGCLIDGIIEIVYKIGGDRDGGGREGGMSLEGSGEGPGFFWKILDSESFRAY